jgi:hypothetical protein
LSLNRYVNVNKNVFKDFLRKEKILVMVNKTEETFRRKSNSFKLRKISLRPYGLNFLHLSFVNLKSATHTHSFTHSHTNLVFFFGLSNSKSSAHSIKRTENVSKKSAKLDHWFIFLTSFFSRQNLDKEDL